MPAHQTKYSYKQQQADAKQSALNHMLDLQDRIRKKLAQRSLVERWPTGILDLEEASQPPDLESALPEQDAHLENAPPFDTGVGAFGGVAVGAFADDDVGLLVLDLGE